MDTAFVTTEHTELHGKEKNGGIKRVRKNTKPGHNNEPIAKILGMVIYSFSHTFEGVRITVNPTDFCINCLKLNTREDG